MKLVLMINKVGINNLCRGYLCLIPYDGTTAGTSHTTVSTPGGVPAFSSVRGQDSVHRQTGEARVPYGGEFPDVESRSLRHRRSRKSQTVIGIHMQIKHVPLISVSASDPTS